MNKIEIEVPQGKVGKIFKQANGNVIIEWEDENPMNFIKTVDDACRYLYDKDICCDLINEYNQAPEGSYTKTVAAYRIVVAALTANEPRHLTTGEKWYPLVQFCRPKDVKNCWGKEVLGQIESEGEIFTVVGSAAYYGGDAGLGYFDSFYGVSDSYARVGFRSVSQREIAEYISKQFGRLLFTVQCGGTNCDWKWIN